MSVFDWLAHESRLLRHMHPFRRARCWLLCESPELSRERDAYNRLSAQVHTAEQEHIERTGEFQAWFRDVEKDPAVADQIELAVQHSGLNHRRRADD